MESSPSPAAATLPEAQPFDTTLSPDPPNNLPPRRRFPAVAAAVNSQRATFGAAINRREYTVDNLTNASQNQSASRSRIQDADYAVETTNLARTQIIAQASTAMLAQANQSKQSVLALLQ